MLIKNDKQNFGLVAITLHWLVAIMTLGLFGLGLWMVELGYYDSWKLQSAKLHEGIGVFLFIALLLRLLWRRINSPPYSLITHKSWEKFAAHLAHSLLNILLLIIAFSGYLIVTANDDPLRVFNLFTIPASISSIPNQEDITGEIHLFSAWILIILVGIHALAAFKHHFIDKDRTLKRMLGL